MKRKIQKISKLALTILTISLFSCENQEPPLIDKNVSQAQKFNNVEKIKDAEKWFNNYKSISKTGKSTEGEFNKAFRNIDYYWENATVVLLDDNTTGIAVPIKDTPEDPNYKGQKMLYLYPTDSKYQSVIQEIFPESENNIDDKEKKEGFDNLNLFSGYIITWDLKKGFIKGAKFENNSITGEIKKVKMVFDEDVNTRNFTGKMEPMFDEGDGVGAERTITVRGGSAAIPLNNVIVVQKSPAPTPKDYSISSAYSVDTGAKGYLNTPTGGGARPIATTSKPFTVITDSSFLNNPCLVSLFNSVGGSDTFQKYLKSFNGSFSVANLKLSASNLSKSIQAQTSPPVNNLINISLNTNTLDRPSLDIARTFMHEMIHAEMFRQLLILASTNGSIDQNELNRIAILPNSNELLEYYGYYVSGPQHELMAVKYRETIISFLKEINGNLTQKQYEALAWQGLQGTNEWKKLTVKEITEIQNTYNAWIKSMPNNCK